MTPPDGPPWGPAQPLAVAVSAQALQGRVGSVAGVPVTNPFGLRRWRASLADALSTDAPIVCVGDSHTFGENANGSLTANPGDNAVDSVLGWVGQLRTLFALTYGAAGEGFWFTNPAKEGRVVNSGGSTFSGPGQAAGPMRQNFRLQTGNTLTMTVPTGATRLVVVQANLAGNVSSSWSLNAVGQGSISSLTGTGIPIVTTLAVVGGQPVVITGPASNADTFQAFAWRTAQTSGVPIHREGVGGNTQPNMRGGVYSGQLGTTDGSSFCTNAEQLARVQSHYLWAGARGLVVMYTGTNEQSLQNTAGIDGLVTPAIMQASVQFAVTQIVSDGWCALLIGPPPSASELLGAFPLSSYSASLQAIAATTDHCAFIDVADLWGGDDSADKLLTSNAGLRDPGSSHPSRAGYGDIARNVYRVLNSLVPVGN